MFSRIISEKENSINEEQFNEIIAAIVSGKYSWACLLLLRFCGYNPLDYIPYRTFNRLMKENPCTNLDRLHSSMVSSNLKRTSTVKDLPYMTEVNHQDQKIIGGLFFYEYIVLSKESFL